MSRAPAGTPGAVLRIGAEETLLTEETASQRRPALRLAIGSSKIARERFKHAPPTPLELENAIAAVEDELERAGAVVSPPFSGLRPRRQPEAHRKASRAATSPPPRCSSCGS